MGRPKSATRDSRKRTCGCGAVIWRTSKQCMVCRKQRGYMPERYVKANGAQVRPLTPMIEDFQLFLMQQRNRLRQSFDRAVTRVRKDREDTDNIAKISRLGGTTLARSTRAEELVVDIRGNASGHAMGRRSPLLAEERMPGSADQQVATRYGAKEMSTLR